MLLVAIVWGRGVEYPPRTEPTERRRRVLELEGSNPQASTRKRNSNRVEGQRRSGWCEAWWGVLKEEEGLYCQLPEVEVMNQRTRCCGTPIPDQCVHRVHCCCLSLDTSEFSQIKTAGGKPVGSRAESTGRLDFDVALRTQVLRFQHLQPFA